MDHAFRAYQIAARPDDLPSKARSWYCPERYYVKVRCIHCGIVGLRDRETGEWFHFDTFTASHDLGEFADHPEEHDCGARVVTQVMES